MSATSKYEKLFTVLPVDEYTLEDSVEGCRDQVLLEMLVMLMDKVQCNVKAIDDLRRDHPGVSKTGVSKRRRAVRLPAKLRAKRKWVTVGM